MTLPVSLAATDRMQTDVIQLGHCQLLTRAQSDMHRAATPRPVTQAANPVSNESHRPIAVRRDDFIALAERSARKCCLYWPNRLVIDWQAAFAQSITLLIVAFTGHCTRG